MFSVAQLAAVPGSGYVCTSSTITVTCSLHVAQLAAVPDSGYVCTSSTITVTCSLLHILRQYLTVDMYALALLSL